jgi:hypothetical protein
MEVPQDAEMVDAGESTIRVIPNVPAPEPKKTAEPEADAT